VGALLWIARTTRDDILYAVSQAGRFNHNFDQTHIDAVVHLLGYLKRTVHLTLNFNHCDKMTIEAHADADWAGVTSKDETAMRSTSGTTVTVKNCGTIFSQAVLQTVVALSTTEAEYIALGATIQKMLCLKTLLNEMGVLSNDETVVFEDNKTTKAKAESPVVDFKMRHLCITYHYFKQAVRNGDCRVEDVPSEENTADIFTKALARKTFEYLRTKLLNTSV